MFACLYGRALSPFVDAAVRDLCIAAAEVGGYMLPLTLETAMAEPHQRDGVDGLYVLPFDLPPDTRAESPAQLVHQLFPHATVAISFAAQDICWDKITTQEHLLERGLPLPDTLITSSPDDVREFVREHGFVILKERFGCAGYGHLVVWLEDDVLLGDAGSHRYCLELTSGGPRALHGDRLRYPAPFYAQRLLLDTAGRALQPGQVMRAYVVDHEIPFWTERYRDHYARPADWIVNVSRGAKYRFLQSVSDEAKKIALRAADVIGLRIGAVDLIRTARDGYTVLELDTDGQHMMIDRRFKLIPEYRDYFNLDRWIAQALFPPAPPQAAKPVSRSTRGRSSG